MSYDPKPLCPRIPQRGQAQAKLAISDAESGTVHVYDARSGSDDPVGSFNGHRQPVQVMRFNETHSTVISVDAKGTQIIPSCNLTCCLQELSGASHVLQYWTTVLRLKADCQPCRCRRVLGCQQPCLSIRHSVLRQQAGHRPVCAREGEDNSSQPGRQPRRHAVCDVLRRQVHRLDRVTAVQHCRKGGHICWRSLLLLTSVLGSGRATCAAVGMVPGSVLGIRDGVGLQAGAGVQLCERQAAAQLRRVAGGGGGAAAPRRRRAQVGADRLWAPAGRGARAHSRHRGDTRWLSKCTAFSTAFVLYVVSSSPVRQQHAGWLRSWGYTYNTTP